MYNYQFGCTYLEHTLVILGVLAQLAQIRRGNFPTFKTIRPQEEIKPRKSEIEGDALNTI